MDRDSSNYEVVYCADDDEYRVFCETCDRLCIERYYKNHLKSGTHTNTFSKRQDSILFNSTLTEPKQ